MSIPTFFPEPVHAPVPERTIQERLRRIERHSGYQHLGDAAADLIDELATALEDMLCLLDGKVSAYDQHRIDWASARLKDANEVR